MENKIDILISAKDQATKVIGKIDKSVKDSQATFKKMAVVGGVAFGALSGAIYKSIDSAQESQRVNAQLESVLKSTGNAVGLTAKQIQAHSSAMQKNLGISDEVIVTGQNMLLTFTNIGKETFPQATETLLDMATAMNNGMAPSAEALSAQAIQLGKALNDPIKGISALSRVGVTFTEQQKETIKSMTEMGDVAGAQKIILDELAREFGGSALAQAQTFEGQMRKLKVTFEDIFENIGMALIPALQKLVAYITPIITKITEWTSAHPELTAKIILVVGAISGLIFIIGTLGLALPGIITGLGLLGGAIGAITGPIGLVIIALGAFLIAWQKDFLGMRTATEDWGASVYDTQVLVTGYLGEMTNGYTGFFENLGAMWYDKWTGIKNTFITIGAQIVEAGRSSFTQFKTIVNGIVGEVWEYVQAKLRAIRDTLREIVSLGRAQTSTYNSGGVSGARALGGPVTNGNTYLVGERGPELFTPSQSGNITPNNKLNGGVNISINMGGVTVRNDNDIQSLARAIKDELTRDIQLQRLGIS